MAERSRIQCIDWGCALLVCLLGASCNCVVEPVACDLLDGRTFHSVELLDGGLGPAGPVLSRWVLTFSNGSFGWTHSDMAESGSYTCESSDIHALSVGLEIEGRLDATTGILSWDGVDYAPVP